MHKFYRAAHDHLLLHSPLKNQAGKFKFFTPTSYYHNPRNTQFPNSKLDYIFKEFEEFQSEKPLPAIRNEQFLEDCSGGSTLHAPERSAHVHIEHPWSEWVELMELLLKRGYFEDGENPFRNDRLGPKDLNLIRTACLNFARDRFEFMRFFSRAEIRVLAGAGCPSSDRKVVNSGKRLRGYVGIDEGNVCSSCILRGNCERAYVKARKDEGGRTVDVMRILLTYGLDDVYGTVENKPCQNRLIKESVRKLLTEMVALSRKEPKDHPSTTPSTGRSYLSQKPSLVEGDTIRVPMKQGDWHCPKCNFLNFARNIRCLRCDGLFHERVRNLGEDQDHLPLKKGDWICEVCNFLNFAKNTRCLQCKEKPKRELHPGEWECESCNYINFRKNMVCLKCDHRRPGALKQQHHSAQSFHNEGQMRGQLSHRQARHTHKESSGEWSFVDDGRYDEPNPLHFTDFPLKGGKSELSQSKEKQEQWKMGMLNRGSRHSPKVTEHVESRNAKYKGNQRKFELLESTDDEEMAEWFGHGKKIEMQKLGAATADEKI